MLKFNTVYVVSIRHSQGETNWGIAIGPRPFRGKDANGVLREGVEWIPNSPVWERKYAFVTKETEEGSKIVARDTVNQDAGDDIAYVFEPLTLAVLERMKDSVQGYSDLVAMVGSDDELQAFYFNDWMRDEWTPISPGVEEDIEDFYFDQVEELLREAASAPVGDVRYWQSKGWVEKQRDGTWQPVEKPEAPETAPVGTVIAVKGKHFQKRSSGFWKPVKAVDDALPGRWKEKAEGLPSSSHKEYWDPGRGDYRPERKALHERIKSEVLGNIVPVSDDRRPVAVITMGLPAAGKSSAIKRTINRENFAHIDTDHIREQLPEFKEAVKQRAKNGGTIVWQEAANVADDLFNEARSKNMNLVFEAVGSNPWILEQIERLKEDRYKVAVVMVHEEDVEVAIEKAEYRGKRSGRFVPHKRIRDAQPLIPKNFLKALPSLDEFSVYQAAPGGEAPVVKWRKDEEGPPRILDQEFHNRFLSLAKLEWMHYEASRRFLQEAAGEKKPADKSLDDVLSMLEKAWEADRVEQAGKPEAFEDGIEEVASDPVPSRS